MPTQETMEALPEGHIERANEPERYWIFRGPAAYRAITPWRPLAGGMAAVGVFLGAVLAVGAVIALSWATNHAVGEVFVNIAGTLVQQITMIALTLFAASRYGGHAKRVLALREPAQGIKAYPIAFLLLIALTVGMNVVVHLIDTESLKSDITMYQDMMKSKWWWLALIVVGIGAPLSEELLCRGFLFSALANSRFGTTGAAVITSLGFAVAHPYSIVGVVQVFLIGLLFAWILIRTGSLRVTMVCHALYNTAMATFLIYGTDP